MLLFLTLLVIFAAADRVECSCREISAEGISTKDNPSNTTDEHPSSTTNGITNVTTDGITNVTTDGTSDGTTDGTTNGTTDGTTNGTTDGTTDGTSDGTTNGTTNGTTDGKCVFNGTTLMVGEAVMRLHPTCMTYTCVRANVVNACGLGYNDENSRHPMLDIPDMHCKEEKQFDCSISISCVGKPLYILPDPEAP